MSCFVLAYLLVFFPCAPSEPSPEFGVISTTSTSANTAGKKNTSIPLKFEVVNGVEMASILGGEVIDLTYIKSLLTSTEATQLVEICNDRNGWVVSPQKGKGEEEPGEFRENSARSSSSCPMLWPRLYLPRYEELDAAGKISGALKKELNLTWSLTQRFAQILKIPTNRFEPFQLIRYEEGQQYREHHDHGAYYGLVDAHRSTTLLIFLSDLHNAGGETNFPLLNIKIEPRIGAGIVWNNIQDIEIDESDGSITSNYVLLEAVHEGLPPNQRSDNNNDDDDGESNDSNDSNDNSNSNGNNNDSCRNKKVELVKYAMNVWIREEEVGNLDTEAYKT